MLHRVAIAALLMIGAAAQAQTMPSSPPSQLLEAVTRLLAAGGMPEDAISAMVIRGDKIVLAHLAERPMKPASTIKLVIGLVSLEQLGPVFKGRTELRSIGLIEKGVLKGDLIVRGGADADFSSEALDTMLRALRNQGIRKIAGNLVFDRQLFNPGRLDIGAAQFDENTEAYTNVIPDALMVNKNMLQVDLRSDGKQLQLALAPALEGVSVDSDITLSDGACTKWDEGWQHPEVVRGLNGKLRVMLHGTYPRNCARAISLNLLDRQEYLSRLLRANWTRLGGAAIAGDTVDGITPPESHILAAHVSRALPEILRDTNKTSDNTLARTVYLSLGSLEADPVLGSRPIAGASAENTLIRSDMAVRTWLRSHGIDDAGLVIENGSGLSRMERVSPLQLARLLQAGQRSNWAPEFQASMPIVAVDGTMRRRLKDSPAAAHARMKTGTLRDVVAVAGYVNDASGQQCVVVAMINSDLVGGGKGTAVLDALVDWVARN
jgi:D-alanyl-D-alanine carboxypeptidase/D-alanyl-D-alanine-endopeptidase (penicillin-binding protein 4)